MKIFTVSAFILLASPVMAENALEEAITFCIKKTPTHTLEEKCMRAVRSGCGYFSKVVLKRCNRAATWDVTIKCFAAGAGNTDTAAVKACDRSGSWEVMNSCMKAIAHKKYFPVEIKNCDSRSDWNSTISCFKNSGQKRACDEIDD